MKKALAMMMAVLMMLALGATAFAAGNKISPDEAKQIALDYAGVKAAEASFTKANRDWDDGREVYEIEFYAGNTEYEMDVDACTGRVTDFSMEYCRGFGSRPSFGGNHYYDDDWDDRYDFDDDDWFDWD